MTDRGRILTAIHGFTLALIAIGIAGATSWAADGSVGGSLVGAVAGAVAGAFVAAMVGLVWRSSAERAAERRATNLEEQIRELRKPESPRQHMARMARDTSVHIRRHID